MECPDIYSKSFAERLFRQPELRLLPDQSFPVFRTVARGDSPRFNRLFVLHVAYIESFNATLRDDCLNQHWFRDIKDARETIEAWRKVYNTIKPHGSLARMTPQAFAAAHPLGGEKEFKLTG